MKVVRRLSTASVVIQTTWTFRFSALSISGVNQFRIARSNDQRIDAPRPVTRKCARVLLLPNLEPGDTQFQPPARQHAGFIVNPRSDLVVEKTDFFRDAYSNSQVRAAYGEDTGGGVRLIRKLSGDAKNALPRCFADPERPCKPDRQCRLKLRPALRSGESRRVSFCSHVESCLDQINGIAACHDFEGSRFHYPPHVSIKEREFFGSQCKFRQSASYRDRV